MSPPMRVTEDTPPDMLAGSMDLRVVLPGGRNVKMSVDRSTPMMDLLVQVTTANKISPGDHMIQAMGERGVLPYKPSTPIGALDIWTIQIMPKSQMVNIGIKKAPLKPINQPFEQTFRLQVHLPRNQLYVSRVSPKARLSDILLQVCSEKNLDPSRYSLRHPTNLDQLLNLKCTLADYKLQEVTVVCNTTLPVEVSTVDIMALQRDSSNNYINRNNKSCDGSVSSGSLGGRSLSPVPSDESSTSPPPPPPSRPIRKRRPAPKPPTINNIGKMNGEKLEKETEISHSTTVICHSRNSSDSSGYHEASVLSESPQSHSLPDSLPRRSKLPSITSEMTETSHEVNGNNLSRSLSSLTAVDNSTIGIRQYNHSISTSSLSTVGGRKKKAAPPPPPIIKMSSLKEEQQRTSSVSSTTSSTTTLDGNDVTVLQKAATLPVLSRVPSIIAEDPLKYSQSSPVDDISSENPETHIQESSPDIINEHSELRLADEEIDRIFHNATRDHISLESAVDDETPLSLSSLPSPPASLIHKDIDTSQSNDPLDWEYKLPAPPTFRDESNSPSVTEYGTLTIGNLTDVFGPPFISQTDTKNQSESMTILKNQTLENNTTEEKNKINPSKRVETNEISFERKSPENTIIPKEAVIKELSSIITERVDRVETNVESSKKHNTDTISSSTLENFTITTYKDTKPVEVFEDESIKSSVGEKRDTSKDDALFRAPKARVAEPNLSRTNSFNTEEKSFYPSVKRSVSYVSLLAANMPRTSQPYRAHLVKSNFNLNDKVADSSLKKEESWPKLRKTSSELDISRGINHHKMYEEQIKQWQKRESESSDLQSVQVLRSILPRLNQSQNEPKVVEGEELNNTLERVGSISRMKTEHTLLDNEEKSETDLDLKENHQFHYKPKYPETTVDEKSNKSSQQYTYTGRPTINLSTWSERPKRQVSIKNDRDYVIGAGKTSTNNEEKSSENREVIRETSKIVEDSNIKIRLVSRTNSRTERPKSAIDLGHVPIVRSVELKKTFVGTNIEHTQTLPSTQTFGNITTAQESFVGVNSLAQKFGNANKRPVSSYLFGAENLAGSENTQNQSGTSKVLLNTGKKFTSVVGINGPQSELEEINEKKTSRIHIGGFEDRKLKLNTTLPNKIDYTSSSDIKALSKIRSGGIIDPSSPTEVNKHSNFSDVSYSSKNLNESRNPVTSEIITVTPKKQYHTYTRSNSSQALPSGPKTNIFVGSNTIDRTNSSTRPNNFPLPVVKGFRSLSEGNETSGGIPPPPVLPVLKPVGSKKGLNSLPLPQKDPRDQLLESIRSFGKDGLKKVSK